MTEDDSRWNPEKPGLRTDLHRLMDLSVEPYDSLALRLGEVDLTGIESNRVHFVHRDSTAVRWINDSTMIIDPVGWNRELYYKEVLPVRDQTRMKPDALPARRAVDFSALVFGDSALPSPVQDTLPAEPEPQPVMVLDTLALNSLGIRMFPLHSGQRLPFLRKRGPHSNQYLTRDSLYVVRTDTLYAWMADTASPLRYLEGPGQTDSLQAAMQALLKYNEERDSTHVVLNDMFGMRTPLWLSGGKTTLQRYWVKNSRNDSITLWIGNPAKREISLLLEDDVDFSRPELADVEHLPLEIQGPDRTLATTNLLKAKPVFWDYDLSSAFTLNQTFLSNWSKGGESSLATMLDMTGTTIYNNKDAKTQWTSSMRVKYGILITSEDGMRKNHDLWEINSQYNKNKWGKVDLSATFYMKNQLARGYNYPNDSVVVSRFLNPTTMTLGLGLEYKPVKNTTINLAPLSYKNTFVLDTARIDQTKHGIKANKRANQEMGTQLLFKNKVTPLEDLTLTNTLRLFSSYLNHPENIDVDWEFLLEKKISWFFTARFNFQLIYDDDIRFTVYDDQGDPVLLPGGQEKASPKMQIKEFVGLSLLFKL
ncbi:MAG: DUF3078 domain-containing protein [Bacteroidales bacterium]